MPKKFIRGLLPDHQSVKDTKALKVFGALLHDPNLWHLNRRSAAGAFAIGLFFAFWPVPFQMWLSAAVAIPFRVNLPVSVATVWITNPFTMPPIFYAAYKLGATVLGAQKTAFSFELSWAWLMNSATTVGPSFLVGCGLFSVVFSIIGYYGLDSLWRYSVAKAWEHRKQSRIQKR